MTSLSLPSLSFAFETLKTTKTRSVSAKDVDLREYSRNDRAMLAQGQLVSVAIGGQAIVDLPRALFQATSTESDMLAGGVINLPSTVDKHGVSQLVEYMKTLTFSKKRSLYMASSIPLYDMLSVTAAAKALGMSRYTDHIYKKCEGRLRNTLPTYNELDACIHFAETHARLFRILASENLAVRMWEKEIPDIEDFNDYLENHPLLKHQIELATHQRNKRVYKAQEQAKKVELAKFAAKHTEAAVKRKEQNSQAFWQKKNSESATNEQSVLQKMKLSGTKRKFTPAEAAHYRKTRGTNKLPKGC